MTGWTSQPSAKTPRVGFLATGSREGRGFLVDSFLRGLRERGYVEGQTIEIEYRFSDAQDERLPALAAELVERKVDVILASGTPATFAAKRATSTIPIVMPASAADPVATGLVASFANPGGNITGLSALTATGRQAPGTAPGDPAEPRAWRSSGTRPTRPTARFWSS